jgi:hypothetical protein
MKIAILCIAAAAANYALNTLFVYVLKIPMYLDTVFTVAVSFKAGLLPGLFTALFTHIATGIRESSITPFVICSFAEVLLVCLLFPAVLQRQRPGENTERRIKPDERTIASQVSIFSRLLLLYIISCITISVLGGLIDFFHHSVLLNPKNYFSAEDTFKISLIRNELPTLAIDILSRIPVNIVDRFIVIFGGFVVFKVLNKIPALTKQHTKSPPAR